MTNQQPEESSNLGDLEDFTYYMRGKVEALEMVMKSFLQVALGNDEARTAGPVYRNPARLHDYAELC